MLYLGSDHAGFKLKEKIKKYLDYKKIKYEDLGVFFDKKKVDYPDYAFLVGKKVAKSISNKGILICGTGTGMCIAANKIKKIRAIYAPDVKTARSGRQHNDVNILCLSGQYTKIDLAKKIINIWLITPFDRAKRRIRRNKKLEKWLK